MTDLDTRTTGTEQAVPPKGIAVRTRWQQSLLTHLLILGPGLIVMEADNDAGAVSTYTQAGGQYGLHLLWLLLLLLPVCYFIQEMVARLGIATGQGHAAMIYKRFGKWWGRFSLFDLLLVNFLTLVTEFAAISLATTKMGISPWLSVPFSAVALIALVLTGSYLRWERITIGLCLLDFFWVLMAAASHTGVGAVLHNALIPNAPPKGWTPDLVMLVVAIVGTTIAPWQLFFQQSAVADKRLRFKDLTSARLDTFIGSCFTILVAGAMMCVGNVLYTRHVDYSDPAQMAVDIGPIVGYWVRTGVLLFMINAAVLGTTAISLASAWAYAEVREWPHSLQMPFRQARGFYLVYIVCTLLAAAIVLIPRAPLQLIIIGVQVLAGLMLPSAIIFLQLLLNDRQLLGDWFINRRWNNVVNWTIVIVLFTLSLVLAAQVLAPGLFPKTA
ncbi:MAG TPA: Nramp family divalent metal transporter [Chthonomonadaceae bacterium]|nr:Nramp family divalent metal transporter [Chthonomonadaceae bacterium]